MAEKETKIEIANILIKHDPELKKFIHGGAINELYELMGRTGSIQLLILDKLARAVLAWRKHLRDDSMDIYQTSPELRDALTELSAVIKEIPANET